MRETAVRIARASRAGDTASTPVEWAVECVQLLVRAAARSERSFALSQEVLDRVSRGCLPPAAPGDALAEPGRTRGVAYAGELALLNARFLAGLAQAAAGDSDGRPRLAAEPEAPAAWFQQIADEAMTRMSEALTAYVSHVGRAAAGETSAASPHPQPWPDIGRVARSTFDLLNDLTDLRARYQEEYLRSVLAAGDGWESVTPFVVELAAAAGDVATASVALQNTNEDRIVVRGMVPYVRRADGVGPAFAPRLGVEPDGFALEPGGEAMMRLSLTLDAAAYEPDALYVGTLQVTREPGSRLDVPLRIVATSRAAPAQLRTDPR